MKSPLEGIRLTPATVKISKIKTDVYVRTGINQSRVKAMQKFKEGGGVLPPVILVRAYEVDSKGQLAFTTGNDEFAMLDGRHRLWLEDNVFDEDDIKSQIVPNSTFKTESELIAAAFKLNNPDGPLAPDDTDIEHTIEMLLERKTPKDEIPVLLGLPRNAVRKYVNDVETRWERAKVLRAHKDVIRNDLPISEAARKHDTTPEKLKAYIAGNARRKKASEKEEILREISSAFKGLNSKLHGELRFLNRRYDDGDVSADDVFAVLKRIDDRLAGISATAKDLRSRFEAKTRKRGK